ncbi:ABC transporter ATP-binding protein [Streptococcus suis]|uniref:ABC transporter ATP-binding protein n=2 Tax=Streptococcus suis TaxID=1307 RepID=UPI001CF345B7|nr:ABC transporter ATP-binding protein [Streptococcus suis]MCB2893580.1 ABC transporter ATP-binding protein [Streptococcus suis]
MAMLEVKNLSVNYGVIEAVKDVSFEVNEGEVVTLIGANGAGKTSILRTISGLVRPSAGTISFLGNEIQKVPARKIVADGLSQVPEGRHVFAGLTVMENLEMGAFLRNNREENQANLKKIFARFPRTVMENLEMGAFLRNNREENQANLKKIFARFPRLEERKNQDAATLSGGEQQMLAMGRALMSQPKLLLLDEPSMGLAPIFIQEIFDIIQDIQKQGTTVLLIEQNANKALAIADRGYVLETGKVVLSGTGKELLASEEVKKAYLGG